MKKKMSEKIKTEIRTRVGIGIGMGTLPDFESTNGNGTVTVSDFS